MKKGTTEDAFVVVSIENDTINRYGRGERIRTFDLTVPNRAR